MFQSIAASLLASVMLLSPQISIPKLDVSDWKALCPGEPIYGITMWAGESSALVNGVPVELEGAPFVDNDVFYYPLKDVVLLYGDSYAREGDSISIKTEKYGTYHLEVGSSMVTDEDGAVFDNSIQQEYFLQPQPRYRKELTRPLMERDGVLYAPVGFRLRLREGPSYIWAVSQYPESGFVIFHGSEPNNEFLGFQILSDFASVPWERRRDMTCLGVQASGIRDNYDEVEYRADGYSVFVLQLQPGGCNLDQLDGKNSAIIVDTPKYATRRGLRCGDSAERAWNLYGAEMLTSFGYEVENGVVTRYGFRSPYYTMCGIPSMFLLY